MFFIPIIILLILIFIISTKRKKYKKEIEQLKKQQKDYEKKQKTWMETLYAINGLWLLFLFTGLINRIKPPLQIIVILIFLGLVVVADVMAVIASFKTINKAKKLRKAKR